MKRTATVFLAVTLGLAVPLGARAADGFEFVEKVAELALEVETLNAEARQLEEQIAADLGQLLAGSNA